LGRGFDNPSAFNTRRTVVADAPIPKNRFITSRIRRAPAAGSDRFAARIAARRALGRFVSAPFGGGRFSSPAAPPLRYRATHSSAVVYGTPSRVAVSCAFAPSSTTARATATRTSSGQTLRVLPPVFEGPGEEFFAIRHLQRLRLSAKPEDGC
jgi:hypothetical protein